MIDLLRSLPQGMLWYPLLLALALALGRVVWSVGRRFAPRRLRTLPESDHLASLISLVHRAQTDSFADRELERRCIGLLLQASGYNGYSVENCRNFLAASPSLPAAAAVESHLTGIDQDDRINHILEAVERIAEAPRG